MRWASLVSLGWIVMLQVVEFGVLLLLGYFHLDLLNSNEEREPSSSVAGWASHRMGAVFQLVAASGRPKGRRQVLNLKARRSF